VVSHWQYAGRGLSAGEHVLAAAITGKPLASDEEVITWASSC
jgi:hypothetical protein